MSDRDALGSTGDKNAKKAQAKELLRTLYDGLASPEEEKQFEALLQALSVADIAQVEDELVNEGLPREAVRGLCDSHSAMLPETPGRQTKALAGHPINILETEHSMLLNMTRELVAGARKLSAGESADTDRLQSIAAQLKESELHYLREENVLFPFLEKHGVTGPTTVMWSEHDQIRPLKKEVQGLVGEYCGAPAETTARQLAQRAVVLLDLLDSHYFKEGNMLFPTALELLAEDEWSAILRDFDEIGYPSFSASLQPHLPAAEPAAPTIECANVTDGVIHFETGDLTPVQLEAILSTLPVDITFVDAEGRVRFFSNNKDRIFVRAKSVIGRPVHLCHPQKSLHLVAQIVNEFKSGERDSAEFWIPMDGRMIHIRFFAVRDRNGTYLGGMEVVQDITEIQKLTGQKRLL